MPSPYGYTDSTEVVANYIFTQLKANIASFSDPAGSVVQDVFYGDSSELYPRTPCMAVVPAPEQSVYNGVGGRPVMTTFQTIVMVYSGKIQDRQQNVHASLTIANAVKRFVNLDATLGGNVIDCMCSAVDPGVAVRGGALLDASRLTFRSRSKVTLNA